MLYGPEILQEPDEHVIKLISSLSLKLLVIPLVEVLLNFLLEADRSCVTSN